VHEDTWEGVRRVHIPVTQSGAKGTIVFDWKSTLAGVGADAGLQHGGVLRGLSAQGHHQPDQHGRH